MIRLAFVADKNDTVAASREEDRVLRNGQRPKGLDAEIGKMFFGEHAIVGSVTYEHSIELFSKLDPGEKELFVLTRNKDFDLRGNTKATIVTDMIDMVERFKSTDEVLVVGGGVAVWEAVLPYADEMVIARSHTPLAGDMTFSSWRDAPLSEVKRESWDGGETLYFKKG